MGSSSLMSGTAYLTFFYRLLSTVYRLLPSIGFPITFCYIARRVLERLDDARDSCHESGNNAVS